MKKWRKIKGFRNYYISDEGDCFNIRTQKYLKKRYKRHGYIEYHLYQDGIHYWKLAHRLVASEFIPDCCPWACREVDHINNDPHDNSLNNLRYLLKSQNLSRRDFRKSSKLDEMLARSLDSYDYNNDVPF